MSVFLGVDGGGTKTALCLIDQDGRLLASGLAPSCYYLEAGITEGPALIERVLGGALPQLCAEAGIEVAGLDFAFLGLPGYGEVSEDLDVLDALPARVLGHHRYRCDNDVVCGWAGSLGLADGINVVSGTGSIAYGQRGAVTARVGGWGELFGDEGSGYWLGIRALQAFSQMTDGRLAAGPLAELLAEELPVAAPLDLVDLVHRRWQGDRGRIAALSRVVAAAGRAGDVRASQLLDEAAAELVRLVDAARTTLAFEPEETVAVSYSGGVFGAAEVSASFARILAEQNHRYDLRTPRMSPVLGAGVYAAELAGTPLSDEALDRLAVGPEERREFGP